jgi:hypothetical protein
LFPIGEFFSHHDGYENLIFIGSTGVYDSIAAPVFSWVSVIDPLSKNSQHNNGLKF